MIQNDQLIYKINTNGEKHESKYDALSQSHYSIDSVSFRLSTSKSIQSPIASIVPGGIVQQTFIPHAELRTRYKCLDVRPDKLLASVMSIFDKTTKQAESIFIGGY